MAIYGQALTIFSTHYNHLLKLRLSIIANMGSSGKDH